MWHKISRRLARVLQCDRQNPISDTPVISMTFDDVPRSACTIGADLLARYDAKATWYVSGHFDNEDTSGRFHTGDILHELYTKGHEIACHGYGHLNYQKTSAKDIHRDIEANLRYFTECGLPAPKNFAYPYGCVSPRVKPLCGARFRSCRGIHHGINRRNTDLTLLRSVPFYTDTLSQDQTRHLIDDLARNGGWLTFFSHGVEEQPSIFDCTPDHLDQTLAYATSLGIPLLTVNEALNRLYKGV